MVGGKMYRGKWPERPSKGWYAQPGSKTDPYWIGAKTVCGLRWHGWKGAL